MTGGDKIRVAVLYGGRSSEHEVSRLSARSVIAHLDRERFELVPIAIDQDGRWLPQQLAALDASDAAALPIDRQVAPLSPPPWPLHDWLGVDVAFPVMHGPNCEDGSLQGLLELAGVPYVGAGVVGSAICMDKDVAKRLAAAAGIEHTPYVAVRDGRWQAERSVVLRHVAEELGYPVFVKPANQGSSVGIARAADGGQLERAVDAALEYDSKVLIERAVDAREIELAVLGSGDRSAAPEVSLPGEIVASDAFYSYDRKYLEADGAELHVPAELTAEQLADAQRMAAQIFLELECEGMVRVDLFLDRQSGRLLFNEANTIPGFTAISMYPKLWEASGLPYAQLLSRLVDLALLRGRRRAALRLAR